MQAEETPILKILLLGNSPVGKTSLFNKFCRNLFQEKHRPTIGADFATQEMELNGKAINLQIVDTEGKVAFTIMGKTYYSRLHGMVFVYDITSKQSFVEISKWVEEAQDHTNSDVPKLLVGNKSDLNGAREVTSEEGQQMANTLGMLFIETSAKEGFNVEQAFKTLSVEALPYYEKQKKESESKNK